jgi:hypothetical protein
LPKLGAGRRYFRDWVDTKPDPGWQSLPFFHTTKAVGARDILTSKEIAPQDCKIFGQDISYFFYGRPAYRIAADGAVKVESSCPFCFMFEPSLAADVAHYFAFDTGAFSKRLYTRHLEEEMNVEDFEIGNKYANANKLISVVFEDIHAYLSGNTSRIHDASTISTAFDSHVRAYLALLASHGRNEPDDRVCSIEAIVLKPISIGSVLHAIIFPHTVVEDVSRIPILQALAENGVKLRPYLFVPNRHPEHYHTLLEQEVIKLLDEGGFV